MEESTGNKVYLTREELMREWMERVLASPQATMECLIRAGILDQDGELAPHLR